MCFGGIVLGQVETVVIHVYALQFMYNTKRVSTTREKQPQSYLMEYTSMKHFKISCQGHKIGSLLLYSRCMANYTKTCSFLHADFTEHIKVVEIFLKAYDEKIIY